MIAMAMKLMLRIQYNDWYGNTTKYDKAWDSVHNRWDVAVQQIDIDGLVHDCSNSIANALELLQSCTKPPIYAC